MTLGIWNKQLLDTYRVGTMDKHFRVPSQGEENADITLQAIGQSYTLFWYVAPPLYTLAILGDALNEAPLYIYKTHYFDETFLDTQDGAHEMRFKNLFSLDAGSREFLTKLLSKLSWFNNGFFNTLFKKKEEAKWIDRLRRRGKSMGHWVSDPIHGLQAWDEVCKHASKPA